MTILLWLAATVIKGTFLNACVPARASDAHGSISTMRRISVISVITALVAVLVWFGISYASRDHNRGFDTTCGDFLGMSHAQQLTVMKTAGVAQGHYEEAVTYYVTGCRPHPEDRNHPIGDIMG